MEIIRGIENLKPGFKCAVTVGMFDGIHPGHLRIIKELTSIAEEKNLCSTLVTFDPHPKLVLKPSESHSVKLLTTIDEKIEILGTTELNRIVVLKFDKEFASQSYETFVKEILIEKIGAKAIVIGYDHAFGRNREGNYENLQKLTGVYDFELFKINPYEYHHKVVSSTVLRNMISDGKVDEAGKFLGRRYSLGGKVVPGNGRGKQLNFPTANIEIQNKNKLIPEQGVYAVDVKFEDKLYKGMLNIGYQPTFGDAHQFTVEVHIHNFHQDIYNKEIKVYFKKRLRNEIKFDSVDALIAQLEIDKQNSLKL